MKEKEEGYHSFRIAVPEDFKHVFSHFYFAENYSDKLITRTLLPSFQTILIFNFGAKTTVHSRNNTEIEIDKCLVLGPIKQAFEYSLPPNSKILVANFKDDGFFRFFGKASVAEYLPVDPDELVEENCFTALWAELSKLKEVGVQVNFILGFCKPYLKHRNPTAEHLSNFKHGSLNPIKAIAGQQQQTVRNIQLRHKKYLGYSAKEIARYQRFLKAIEQIESIATSTDKIDWYEVVNHCGYFDQSQMIHDFNYYINLSPTKYLRFQQDICNPKTD